MTATCENFGAFQKFAQNRKRGVFIIGTAPERFEGSAGGWIRSDIDESCASNCNSEYICLTSRFYAPEDMGSVLDYFVRNGVKSLVLLEERLSYSDYKRLADAMESNGWEVGDRVTVSWTEVAGSTRRESGNLFKLAK